MVTSIGITYQNNNKTKQKPTNVRKDTEKLEPVYVGCGGVSEIATVGNCRLGTGPVLELLRFCQRDGVMGSEEGTCLACLRPWSHPKPNKHKGGK